MYVYAAGGEEDAGIELSESCIGNWTCKLQIYETLHLRTDTGWVNTPTAFVQDIFLGATFFIGTLATFWLVVSGMMMVFWGASENMYEKGKKWMQYSIIAVLLVVLSYTIIRIVQYVAQGK